MTYKGYATDKYREMSQVNLSLEFIESLYIIHYLFLRVPTLDTNSLCTDQALMN